MAFNIIVHYHGVTGSPLLRQQAQMVPQELIEQNVRLEVKD
jgi:hypothetical protein